MSWASLASNQMVSYTDAQGGGFTLQSGQSSVTSNQCMTKNDALTKYVLDSSYMDSYSSNQLVPKSQWVSGGIASIPLYINLTYDNQTGNFVENYNFFGILDATINEYIFSVDNIVGGTNPITATVTLIAGHAYYLSASADETYSNSYTQVNWQILDSDPSYTVTYFDEGAGYGYGYMSQDILMANPIPNTTQGYLEIYGSLVFTL